MSSSNGVGAETKPRLTGAPARGAVVLAVAMCAGALPADAQFFSNDRFFNDRPMRSAPRQLPPQQSFGGFDGFSQPQPQPQPQPSLQRRAYVPRDGWGAPSPPVQQAAPPIESRFPFRLRQPRKPPQPIHVDYSRPPAAEKPDAAPKRNIIVIGDEMADWLAYGLETVLSDQTDLGVTRQAKQLPGLIQSRPKRGEPSDWLVTAKAVATTEHIDAIVVMLGMHDNTSIRELGGAAAPRPADADAPAKQPEELQLPSEEADAAAAIEQDKTSQPANGIDEFRSARWVELYSSKVRRMMAVLKSRGVPVVWVGMPSMKGQQVTADMLFLDDLYRDSAAKAGITYVDLWGGFVDDAGHFLQYGPDFEGQVRKLRTPDGVFFTRRGAMKLAHYAEREISKLLAARTPPIAVQQEPAPPVKSPGKAPLRPLAGPVVPLIASSVGTTELLGGVGGKQAAADELAVRTLIRGEPLSPPAGRADNFAWPRSDSGRTNLAEEDVPPSVSKSKPSETAAIDTGRLR